MLDGSRSYLNNLSSALIQPNNTLSVPFQDICWPSMEEARVLQYVGVSATGLAEAELLDNLKYLPERFNSFKYFERLARHCFK